MFGFFTKRRDEHLIHGGRVGCPVRGADAEIDECAGCRWLTDIVTSAPMPLVRCRPPAATTSAGW
jgi:hypothetical protein